jgi:pimeloyl-ACP methyl ester carboxylesterase
MRHFLFSVFVILSLGSFSQSREEVSVKVDMAILRGTLVYPEENPTKSVALFFSGSGPTDRDGNTGPQYTNNSLKMLAEGLARHGIASLRYDKRGIGESEFEGNESEVIFDDFIGDGKAWLSYLKSEKSFERIFVIGHSQGSLVGAIVSADRAVDKFVSLAGVSSSADEVILSQLQAQSPFAAMLVAPKLDSLKLGLPVSVPPPPLDVMFRKSAQPFMISWFAYDPKEEFAKVNAPILIVNGTTDIQVSVQEAEALHEAVPSSQPYIVEGMNHVLKDAPNDRMANIKVYSDSTKELSEGLVERIAEFLLSE